jgi:mannose/cellobiose epimerase-like protein (N-acyl-D-glucosamine 2-epimerase family)
VFYKSAPERITTRQQAVMRIRERKQWQESEGLSTHRAATATNRNPIMMLIVRLLAAASVADDRLALTYRASPQDLVTVLFPLSFKLAR